ncbi:MAG: type I-U CRISPR-associated protein Csx17, partial [Candidatus Methylomirabilota bacterium]
ETNDQKVEELLWGFGLVDWRKQGLGILRGAWGRAVMSRTLPRAYCLLSLLHTPEKVRGVALRRESRIVALLKASRTAEACAVAVRRLRVAGLRPRPVAYEPDGDAGRLVGALLIPVRVQPSLESFVLQPSQPQE